MEREKSGTGPVSHLRFILKLMQRSTGQGRYLPIPRSTPRKGLRPIADTSAIQVG